MNGDEEAQRQALLEDDLPVDGGPLAQFPRLVDDGPSVWTVCNDPLTTRRSLHTVQHRAAGASA